MDFGYRKLYVNGVLRDACGGRRHDVICPATDQKVAEIAWATPADAHSALEAARDAFPNWSVLSIKDRAEWMAALRDAVMRREEELRLAVMYEMGKPWEATAEDYQTIVNALEWYAAEVKHTRDLNLADEENTHSHEIVSQPLGVAVAFLAWNFPLLNVGFKLGPAMAAGCTLIIRPSSSSPLSAYLFAEACEEIGLPPGVVNVLCGPAAETATPLSSSPIPRLVTMIGSSETGRRLVAESATTIKRMSMELGGNAPVLVFPDADLETAARETAALKFGNCGQICVAPNRIFVHRDVSARFLRLFRAEAAKVRMGFGRDSGVTMGPLIDRHARERVHAVVREAIADGAQLICGGEIPDGPGSFYPPTILTGVTTDMCVAREEIFGPVAALIEFDNEADVIAEANSTEYGLVAYCHTRDEARCRRLARALEFGEVMLNGFKYAIYLPHGGVKESGIGKDCSHYALDDYVYRKRVTTRLQ